MKLPHSFQQVDSIQHTISRSRRYDDLPRHRERRDEQRHGMSLKRAFEEGAWATVFLTTNPVGEA